MNVAFGEDGGAVLGVGNHLERFEALLRFEVPEDLGRLGGVDLLQGVSQVHIRLPAQEAADHVLDLKEPGISFFRHGESPPGRAGAASPELIEFTFTRPMGMHSISRPAVCQIYRAAEIFRPPPPCGRGGGDLIYL